MRVHRGNNGDILPAGWNVHSALLGYLIYNDIRKDKYTFYKAIIDGFSPNNMMWEKSEQNLKTEDTVIQ